MSRLPVLMYHSIGGDLAGPVSQLAVPPAVLREQLTTLVAAGYQPMSLTEALEAAGGHDKGPTTGRLLGLTFDDGYLDFHEQALPVLVDLGLSATLYPCVGHIGSTASWLPKPWDRTPLMSETQIVEAADVGIEIGSHGDLHQPLDTLPADTASTQIGCSRRILEDLTGMPVRSFCYPHGYHSRRVRESVKASGYDNACAIGHRVQDTAGDRYAVTRLLVDENARGDALLHLVAHGPGPLVPAAKRLAQPGWRLARRIGHHVLGRSWT